mmetsp:Transcript_11498/g.47828  ORF Transcript_11498/g.47828 Transcript_11498/m.47828 type:complete len:213 (-) Transcript_11498:214-852(-)
MWKTQGPSSTCAAIFLRIGATDAHASSGPPGISDGPNLAPSSPPLTPIPIYMIPFFDSDSERRSVFSNHSFPPSMIMSPSSNKGTSASIVASTGAPAFTSMIILRGRSMDSTNSFISLNPENNAGSSSSLCALATASSVLELDLLKTDIENPFSAILRARFCPITASPTRPIFDRSTAELPEPVSGLTSIPTIRTLELLNLPSRTPLPWLQA